jgi:predicted secreted protein
MMRSRCQKSGSYVCFSILAIVLLWLTAGVHAMGSVNKSEEGANVVILQKEDSGREVVMKSGDVIQIELSGSGGTGYWWYVTKMDSKYAELVSEETNPPPDKKLLGGPTKGIWRFKAKEPGKTDLIMKYYRVWEGPEKAVDEFSVILNIK